MSIRPTELRQPWLHELSVCVNGNVAVLSDYAGQIDGTGAQGVFADDQRIVSRLLVTLDGQTPIPIAQTSSGARSDFLASARHLGDPGADPTVEVRRHRTAGDLAFTERIVVASRAESVVRTELIVELAGDGADVGAVKAGAGSPGALPTKREGDALLWEDERLVVRATVDAPGAVLECDDLGGGRLRLPLQIEPGGSVAVTLTVLATRTSASSFDADAGSAYVDWSRIRVDAQDSALAPTLAAGVDDLRHLLMTDPQNRADLFAAAGAPWYLTLFGRDSLWAARLMLPFDTALAAGTLRALARRQGVENHAGRAEEPGKIAHELRRGSSGDRGIGFGAIYYGSVDATCLWISLLHDAWRWGMPDAEVKALLPNLLAAIGWMTDQTGPATDGLLKYVDTTGTGLRNQGWKDSGDSIRWRDGRIAEAPIALVEAQAYAVEAATSAAALLETFGLDGGKPLLEWAEDMRARVRDRFWVGHEEPGGPWLGIAVDATGRTVDGLASNMGHVLGTGTLTAEESGRVARTLTSPALLDIFGVRTLASDNGGYNPIGYHTGSIWTHDSAICAWNLSRAGFAREATVVVRALLASSIAFGHHWPELYAGADALDRPAPYPAACRPQAWAAASAAAMFSVALGPEPNAPEGRLVLRPCRPSPFGEMTLHGMVFAGHPLTVHCSADGTTTVTGAPPHLTIDVL